MVAGIGARCAGAAFNGIRSAVSSGAATSTAESIIRTAMNPASHVRLMNTAPIVASKSGLFGKISEFLFGNWGTNVGLELRKFMKVGGKLKDFKWVATYKEVTSSAAKEAAKKAAADAGKGIFSKIGSFAGKWLGPVLFLGPAVFSAIGELREGNMGGAVKEVAKGTICMLGYTLGGVVAAALLGTGGFAVAAGTLVISSLVGMGVDMAAKKVLGPSTAEARVELAKQQQQNPFNQGVGGNAFARFASGQRGLTSFGGLTPINYAKDRAQIEALGRSSREIFENSNRTLMI